MLNTERELECYLKAMEIRDVYNNSKRTFYKEYEEGLHTFDEFAELLRIADETRDEELHRLKLSYGIKEES